MKSSSPNQLFSILKLDKKSVTQNKKRSKRLNAEDITIRRKLVKDIIDQFTLLHGRPPREKEIIAELDQTGFLANHNIIYNDKKAIAANSSYLEDLFSVDNYSEYQADNRKWIDFTINKAAELLERSWTSSKTITRETKDGEFTEEVTTEEISSPYAQFLRIIQDGIKLREEHADGKNKKLGVIKLAKKLRQKQDEAFSLKEKNSELEKELKYSIRRK